MALYFIYSSTPPCSNPLFWYPTLFNLPYLLGKGVGRSFGLRVERGIARLLHLLHDCLECLGVVEGEVGEHLAVDLYACLVEGTHEGAVAQVV